MDIYDDYSGEYLGIYKLEEKLGNGSFGAVYRAFDTVLNIDKAIKILDVPDPDYADAVFKEAKNSYKCRHNNIVNINGGDLQEYDGERLFVIDMELCEGGSVEELIEEHSMTVIQGLQIIKDVLYGLEHAHIHSIIHHDIKPANILINNGIAKLSDFGLSTFKNDYAESYAYISHSAPESFYDSTATVALDIFAVGMTLFRMVNSYSNWNDIIDRVENFDKVLRNGALIKKIGYMPFVPSKVKKIINKACHPEPTKRYASAKDMRNDIEKLKFLHDWQYIDDMNWIAGKGKKNCISIKPHKSFVETSVKIDGRKTNEKFGDVEAATKFCMKCIAENTVA